MKLIENLSIILPIGIGVIFMKHNKKYKSIQVNLSLKKHKDIIDLLVNKAEEDETSMNSIIIRALKEYLKSFEKVPNIQGQE